MQITPKIESNTNSILSISTHATRVREHKFSNSLAPRDQAPNIISRLNDLKYVTPASQNPLCTSLALQNTSNSKQLLQIRNKVIFAQREHQITQSQIPPIKSNSTNSSKSHHPKLKSVLFDSCNSRNQLHPPKHQKFNHSLSVSQYVNSINSKCLQKRE